MDIPAIKVTDATYKLLLDVRNTLTKELGKPSSFDDAVMYFVNKVKGHKTKGGKSMQQVNLEKLKVEIWEKFEKKCKRLNLDKERVVGKLIYYWVTDRIKI